MLCKPSTMKMEKRSRERTGRPSYKPNFPIISTDCDHRLWTRPKFTRKCGPCASTWFECLNNDIDTLDDIQITEEKHWKPVSYRLDRKTRSTGSKYILKSNPSSTAIESLNDVWSVSHRKRVTSHCQAILLRFLLDFSIWGFGVGECSDQSLCVRKCGSFRGSTITVYCNC